MPQIASETHSKKERQAMEILYRLGEATVAQVQTELPDEPNYSATRALLGVLVDKGLAKVAKAEGARHYLYSPKESAHKARKGALKKLLSTFFDNSPAELAMNLLDPDQNRMTVEEIDKLQQMIDAHRAQPKV
ncbi:Predicted transcriptional regulator [Prosthecobacter debontii]|uniref:Predicted transcriptional regulator n=1 Tax=Prosthecobacter debontii TaxID=48467 RepID=A0A1T4WHN3_9BACT|nr:BlaI/MecI/CopY family transcriptional regulator [Prosthecobacter debontii]SKA76415.1 Predicted transcriptional regulator [Prosthecobacter debontii]